VRDARGSAADDRESAADDRLDARGSAADARDQSLDVKAGDLRRLGTAGAVVGGGGRPWPGGWNLIRSGTRPRA